MPILRSSPPSPFGRKVKIAAQVAGLYDQLEIVNANTNDPDDNLRTQNVLGKIPVLMLDDGTALYDSRVIVEWLDDKSGGKLLPAGNDRFDALVLQALADGMMDASLLIIYEDRFRPPEMQFQPWIDYQREKVARALNRLEEDPPALGDAPHAGHIALACALGYLDFRFAGEWRTGYPRLVEWLDGFSDAVPAYAKTAPEAA
ncbi:MAG TPA: glutathione S-transferase family protein [Afifellaceae bacterium]|nr:glutathione S-transferase family protein [Afifellaceae bacterium]